MDARQKVVGGITTVVVAFATGFHYSSSIKDAEIAELKEDYARKTMALQEEYRAKEQYAVESMRLAWEQRDVAYSQLRDVNSDIERLRNEASSAHNRLSRTTKDSCHAEREQIARCTKLLSRGGELLGRGVTLSSSLAIDKDAVVTLVQ